MYILPMTPPVTPIIKLGNRNKGDDTTIAIMREPAKTPTIRSANQSCASGPSTSLDVQRLSNMSILCNAPACMSAVQRVKMRDMGVWSSHLFNHKRIIGAYELMTNRNVLVTIEAISRAWTMRLARTEPNVVRITQNPKATIVIMMMAK
jgi:hypothetical protein